MENKKTTELIDLLKSLVDDEGNIKDNEKYEEVFAELRKREPFWTLLEPDFDESLPSAWEAINDLREEVKKLKRHKHDEKSGDVLIRI